MEDKIILNIEDWTDTELTKEWNRLDNIAGGYAEAKSEEVLKECVRRRIYGWDKNGNIIDREENETNPA